MRSRHLDADLATDGFIDASARRRAVATLIAVLLVVGGWLSPAPLAENANLDAPPSVLEQRLTSEDFTVVSAKGSRFSGDRTQRVTLRFESGDEMKVKWAAAPPRGGDVNNRPRYEVGAYAFQKLFLDESDYVVPPTILRSIDPELQSEVSEAEPIHKTGSILVVLQVWLNNVKQEDVFDLERFETDERYRRRLAILNLFSYLVRHNDTNKGNFLISEDPADPRIWAVDNGFAFGIMDESTRGYEWRELRVNRIPKDVVARLRKLNLKVLEERLGVLAQFEIRDGRLTPVPASETMVPGRGVRRKKKVIQFGLTATELLQMDGRLRRLLKKVDRGEIGTF